MADKITRPKSSLEMAGIPTDSDQKGPKNIKEVNLSESKAKIAIKNYSCRPNYAIRNSFFHQCTFRGSSLSIHFYGEICMSCICR